MKDDDERERHIRACGDLMLQAYSEGNRQAAEQWLEAQRRTIADRSPKQISKMELNYFGEHGAVDRATVETLAATRICK